MQILPNQEMDAWVRMVKEEDRKPSWRGNADSNSNTLKSAMRVGKDELTISDLERGEVIVNGEKLDDNLLSKYVPSFQSYRKMCNRLGIKDILCLNNLFRTCNRSNCNHVAVEAEAGDVLLLMMRKEVDDKTLLIQFGNLVKPGLRKGHIYGTAVKLGNPYTDFVGASQKILWNKSNTDSTTSSNDYDNITCDGFTYYARTLKMVVPRVIDTIQLYQTDINILQDCSHCILHLKGFKIQGSRPESFDCCFMWMENSCRICSFQLWKGFLCGYNVAEDEGWPRTADRARIVKGGFKIVL